MIPHRINKIKENAFCGCTNLEKITFESGNDTLHIESSNPLFQDCQLKTITIDKPLEYKTSPFTNNIFLETAYIRCCQTIGQKLFEGCTNLSAVTIGGISKIDRYAFKNCINLKSIGTQTAELDTIDISAFEGCENLKDIMLNKNISYIGDNAFTGCNSLNLYLIAKDPLYHIEKYINAFKEWKYKSLFVLEENLPYYKTSEIWNKFGYIYSIDGENYDPIIPEIPYESSSNYDFEVDGIYYGIESLEQLTCKVMAGKYSGNISIPSYVNYKNRQLTVVAIGNSAFKDCDDLLSIELPKTISIIKPVAFSGCSSLKKVIMNDGVKIIGNGAFYGCESIPDISIPSTVMSIGWSAFERCSSINSITIPNSVKVIGTEAFKDCTSLKNVELSDNIELIPERCFENCDLEYLRIPNKVYIIRPYAFANCPLKSITISPSVMQIDEYVFEGCTSLKEVVFEDGKFEIGLRGGYMKYVTGAGIFSRGAFANAQLTSAYIGRDIIDNGNNLNYSDIKVFRNPFTDTITKLTLGDLVTTNICQTTNTEEVIIGKNLQIGYSFINAEKLKKIYVRSEVPQDCNGFTNATYINATLFVPKGTLSAYKNADVWKNFWDIQEYDEVTTDIERNNLEKSNGNVYNINGVKLNIKNANDIKSLPKGIYIINGKKVMVK